MAQRVCAQARRRVSRGAGPLLAALGDHWGAAVSGAAVLSALAATLLTFDKVMSLRAWGASSATLLSMWAMIFFPSLAPWAIFGVAGAALTLAGVVTAEQALRGFANEGVLTVAVMYAVADTLGRVDVVLRAMTATPGRSTSPAVAAARVALAVGAASSVLNNTPVVAAMIPVVQQWCEARGVDPKLLLMPLSTAALLGGTLTMIGTSTNLVVQGLVRSSDLRDADGAKMTLGVFDITLVGAAYFAVGIAYVFVSVAVAAAAAAASAASSADAGRGSDDAARTTAVRAPGHRRALEPPAGTEPLPRPFAAGKGEAGSSGDSDRTDSQGEASPRPPPAAASHLLSTAMGTSAVLGSERAAWATRAIQVSRNSVACNRSLEEANLRGLGSAFVVAIFRTDAARRLAEADSPRECAGASARAHRAPRYFAAWDPSIMVLAPSRDTILVANDVAYVVGCPAVLDKVSGMLSADGGRGWREETAAGGEGGSARAASALHPAARELHGAMVEVVVASGSSRIANRTLNEIQFRSTFKSVVVAVIRQGADVSAASPALASLRLRAADVLLCVTQRQGLQLLQRATSEFALVCRVDSRGLAPPRERARTWGAEPARRAQQVAPVGARAHHAGHGATAGDGGDNAEDADSASDTDSVRDPGSGDASVLTGARACAAVLTVGAALAASAATGASILALMVVAVALLCACGASSLSRAAASVNGSVLLSIMTSFSLAAALSETGAADVIAAAVGAACSAVGSGAYYQLVGIMLTTSLLSACMSNNSAVAVMFPVVRAIVDAGAAPPRAAVYSLMLGASAVFTSPVGYQTNLMVHAVGGYRLSDWLKFGGPLQTLMVLAGPLLCLALAAEA